MNFNRTIATSCQFVGSALLTFASTLPAHAAEFNSLDPAFVFTFGDSPVPDGVPHSAGEQLSADGQQVKLFGNFGPIDGATFGSGFAFGYHGIVDGPIAPGGCFTVDLDFDVDVTGGDLQWYFFGLLTSVEEGFILVEHAQILTDPAPLPPSGEIHGVHLVSPKFTQPAPLAIAEGSLRIAWSSYSPTDTLTVTIPQQSVDVTYVTAVPEPTTLALLGIAVLPLMLGRSGKKAPGIKPDYASTARCR